MQLSDMTDRLVGLVSDHYKQEFGGSPETPITPASRFDDLGMDDLDFMQLSDTIEDALDVAVPHTIEFRDHSIGELAALVATN